MFKVWNRDIEQVFQLFRDAQELDNFLCLFAEPSIEPERLGGIHFGHFEIVF